MALPVALPIVLRVARRDLRGGARSFVVFFLCVMVGVGAIAAVRSVADSATAGMQADARTLLGGDVEIRLIHRTAGAEQLAFLARSGTVSRVAEMRAMARTESARTRMLIELKAVDAKYPLAGAMALDPAMALGDALAPQGGVYGAAVEKGVLTRLGVRLGDRLRIGDADIEIRTLINREPDRGTDIFSLGPRVMVALDALPATNLVQPGSLVNYRYRLALNKGTDSASWIKSLDSRFPDAGWRVVDLHNVAPGLERLLDRVSLYLTLVGLTALLIGGVGVANAVKTYLDGRRTTIAVLKCVGATGGLVFRIYLAQVMMVALVATVAGLLLGAVAPLLLAAVLGQSLPLRLPFALYPGALGLAGAFGLLTALAFSLWPLAMARETSPAGLFRSLIVPGPARVRARDAAMIGLCAILLSGLVIWPAADRRIAVWFVIGAALILALLVMAARMLARFARMLGVRFAGTAASRGAASLRMGLANLHRPGATSAGVLIAVGIGLVALVAVGEVEANMRREIGESMRAAAPSFYFIDIQPQQLDGFVAAADSVSGVTEVRHVPSLRGRIVKIAGVPVDKASIAPEALWAVQSDRGLTYAALPPEDTNIVAGSWWPPDYRGPPLISLDARIAEGMGLKVGDSLTINVLGTEVEASIANLREIDWSTLGINFVIVFAPGTLEGLPQTHIATVRAGPMAEDTVERAVTEKFPNVSAIRVKDALDAVNRILGAIDSALDAMALVTVAAGLLVLAGAVSATRRQRLLDSVVLRVVGARPRDLVAPFLIEYGLLGLVAGAIAALLGSLAAYVVLTRLMHTQWSLIPVAAAAPIAAGIAVTMLFGLAGTLRVLRAKPLVWLRNE